MFLERGFLNRLTVLFLALSLLVSMVACDSDDDAPPDFSAREPVKIGLLADFSGPNSMAGQVAQQVADLVKYEVEAAGGILDGRTVEFVLVDGYGTIEDSVAAIKQAALDNDLAAMTGIIGASTEAAIVNAKVAEEIKMPFFAIGIEPADPAPYPYMIRSSSNTPRVTIRNAADFVLGDLKAERVALLADTDAPTVATMGELKALLQSAGAAVVYEGYAAIGTVDFTSYLSDIRQADADVLMVRSVAPGTYIGIFTDITKTGGWEDMDFLSLFFTSTYAIGLPAGEGTYHMLPWFAGFPGSTSQRFVQAFADIYDRPPDTGSFSYYVGMRTAVEAIKLAGSDDPDAVARAGRSGDLEWDSPAGPYRIDKNGQHNIEEVFVQVQDGKLILVEQE